MTFAACPDSELLAACAEGRLRGDERERVLRHLTTCHDCYTVFTEALHLLDELPALAAETGEARVPVVGDAQGALPVRLQPVKPSSAEPATPRPLDGTLPAAAPTTPSPSSLGQPGGADASKPDDRRGESRDNVIPFDRRRGRRVATVALPLAAAAALAVVVMQQHPPQGPTAPPVTMAQAPSPEPTPAATPTPTATPTPPSAPLPVDVARLVTEPDWMWEQPDPPSGFSGTSSEGICRFVGVTAVDLDVALRASPNTIWDLLDETVTALLYRQANSKLVQLYERAASEAEHDPRRGVATVESATALCDPDAVQVGRALEWLRLATRTRDHAAPENPEVAAGLAAARRSGSATEWRQLALLLRRWPSADADERTWHELGILARQTMEVWLP